MRQGQNNRRSRGRSNNRRTNAPNRNQTFDSNGPDTRIRGNASQVLEKYQALARDAMSSGDPVMVENYLQHAEHYQRVINQMNEAVAQAQLQAEQAREQRPHQPPQQQNGRALPVHGESDERPENTGPAFNTTSADPREQPSAEFGHDPREERQPDAVPAETSASEISTPDVSGAAGAGADADAPLPAEEAVEAAPPAEPVEKPRRRRPRRVKVEEAVTEPSTAPAD